jgi:anthranilate synthase component 1
MLPNIAPIRQETLSQPPREEFKRLAQRGNLVPVYRELNADLETPVSLYLKLRRGGESFLFESVEGGEQLARYSFIGSQPSHVITIRGNRVTNRNSTRVEEIDCTGNPLELVRARLQQYRAVEIPGLPRFFGGAVGFLGYEMVQHMERVRTLTPSPSPGEGELPDAIFLLTDTLIAYDHVKHRALVIANAYLKGDADIAYDDAIRRIEEVVARVQAPLPTSAPKFSDHRPPLASNVTPREFEEKVRRAQEYIAGGDIFQVVLSQRFERDTVAEPLDIYRALRRLNPSPYLFFLDLGYTQFIGSSPEMLVRLENGQAQLNPIAGTRRRGKTEEEDKRLEEELRADPKERAEHVMLVDLGRNDLGRVCEYGSVRVPKFIIVERYSHVMHLVSHVVGRLRANLDAFDLLCATFPAGTLSGAPKVRAMEIINELEGTRRGPYAGAVGYFGFPTESNTGNMDFCITIRTVVMHGQHAVIQAGAGIVADSIPENEHQECVNKARALAEAIQMAEGG